MLAQAVRNNLKDIENLKMPVRTDKFCKLFRAGLNIKEDDGFVEETVTDETVTEDDIADYIVENPDEVKVEFPIVSGIELEGKLPFFKSISLKLASL